MALRLRSGVLPTVLAIGTAVVSAGSLIGAVDVSAATRPARHTAAATSACVTMRGMSETIVDGSVRDLGGPYPRSVGGSSTYLDHLYDSTGRQVATVYGKANVPMRLAGGDLAEYSDERIEFSDGVLETQGFYDITRAEKGVWQYLPAVGVEGRYRGMVGKRHFKITKLGKSLVGRLELCPAGTAAH